FFQSRIGGKVGVPGNAVGIPTAFSLGVNMEPDDDIIRGLFLDLLALKLTLWLFDPTELDAGRFDEEGFHPEGISFERHMKREQGGHHVFLAWPQSRIPGTGLLRIVGSAGTISDDDIADRIAAHNGPAEPVS
ncbi:MAG: hypothetical protein KBF88_08065, partial [Polyangiaceae bacterium]|nr:hypothetical protein [Polyangiaceae bacterium]